jgi:hypothetical protein
MSNIDKIRATFNKQGYKQSSRFRRPEFENFLNSLVVSFPLPSQENSTPPKLQLKSGSKLLKDRIKYRLRICAQLSFKLRTLCKISYSN